MLTNKQLRFDAAAIPRASTAAATVPVPQHKRSTKRYDKDGNGVLSETEFKDDPDLGGHFGWLDTNDDGRLTAAEWNETRRLISIGGFGRLR